MLTVMHLIIIHRNENCKNGNGKILQFAVTDNPIANIFTNGFVKYGTSVPHKSSCLRLLMKRNATEVLYAFPKEWPVKSGMDEYKHKIITYNNHISMPAYIINGSGQKRRWHVISNGRLFTKINESLLKRVLEKTNVDIVAINAEPSLLGEREKVRLTAQGKVAGFRRQYSDSAKLCPLPEDWPAHLFIKGGIFKSLLKDSSLPVSFSEIMEKCKANSLNVCAVNAGGLSLDLETENGLLEFTGMILGKKSGSEFNNGNSLKISDDSRLVGRVLLGKNIQIGPKSVIIGPTVIGDNVIIEGESVINTSVIGSNTLIRRNHQVYNKIVTEKSTRTLSDTDDNSVKKDYKKLSNGAANSFRIWPVFSYARFFKRIADIFAALIVLILFTPLIPLIAAAIKLTSPGSIFYKDKRQGLHGKVFHCLKFRTMITGASKIQENLRFISQVDGPQFKMADDPRISMVGRFLRETYIDEIPQFFNVLLGQMSIVGPRPSPESENTLCPFWRDARLSVRPGITGLWQINRTRKPMKDFQEWIHYDVEYVRNLSLMTDLGICWKTAKKLIDNFISQF